MTIRRLKTEGIVTGHDKEDPDMKLSIYHRYTRLYRLTFVGLGQREWPEWVSAVAHVCRRNSVGTAQ